MHPIPVGKRYKIVVEDHNLGTVTRKELALEDVEKIMNSRPGTIGKFTEEIDVPLSGSFSPAITLPKGAKVLSAAYHVHQAPSAGTGVGFGTKENGTLIGHGDFNKPFAERAPDSAELEKEETLGFTVQGVEEGQKVESGLVHLVIQYEKFNEWPDLPLTDDEANERAGVARADHADAVAKQQAETDKAVKEGGESARSKAKVPEKVAKPPQPTGATQTKPTTQPGQGAGHQGTATVGS